MSASAALERYLAKEQRKRASEAVSFSSTGRRQRPDNVYQDLDAYIAFERGLAYPPKKEISSSEEAFSIVDEMDNFINTRLDEYGLKWSLKVSEFYRAIRVDSMSVPSPCLLEEKSPAVGSDRTRASYKSKLQGLLSCDSDVLAIISQRYWSDNSHVDELAESPPPPPPCVVTASGARRTYAEAPVVVPNKDRATVAVQSRPHSASRPLSEVQQAVRFLLDRFERTEPLQLSDNQLEHARSTSPTVSIHDMEPREDDTVDRPHGSSASSSSQTKQRPPLPPRQARAPSALPHSPSSALVLGTTGTVESTPLSLSVTENTPADRAAAPTPCASPVYRSYLRLTGEEEVSTHRPGLSSSRFTSRQPKENDSTKALDGNDRGRDSLSLTCHAEHLRLRSSSLQNTSAVSGNRMDYISDIDIWSDSNQSGQDSGDEASATTIAKLVAEINYESVQKGDAC